MAAPPTHYFSCLHLGLLTLKIFINMFTIFSIVALAVVATATPLMEARAGVCPNGKLPACCTSGFLGTEEACTIRTPTRRHLNVRTLTCRSHYNATGCQSLAYGLPF